VLEFEASVDGRVHARPWPISGPLAMMGPGRTGFGPWYYPTGRGGASKAAMVTAALQAASCSTCTMVPP
jgi:hypothetical protein